MGVALCDQADEIAHIPLLDLMDALGAPVGNDVPPQETCYSSIGPDLRDVFANERLHQIINSIDHEPAAMASLAMKPAAGPYGRATATDAMAGGWRRIVVSVISGSASLGRL